MDCIWLYIDSTYLTWLLGISGYRASKSSSLMSCLSLSPSSACDISLIKAALASIHRARRSRSSTCNCCNCSCHCDRHGCVALCRCCVGDWKALFRLPASLQKGGDEGSHENGHLTRRVREFKFWNSSKYCYDSTPLPWDALKVSCLSYYSREWTTRT